MAAVVTDIQAQSTTNPDARRAAAVAKVQGYHGSTTTAKGVPSTDKESVSKSVGPVTYSTPTTTAKGASSAPKTTAKGPAAVDQKSPAKSPAKTTPKTTPKTGEVKPATYSDVQGPAAATTMTVNGHKVVRNVRNGRGQEGDDLFTPVGELHYVQFAVYCKDVPVDRAPAIDGLYLLWHPGSKCPNGAQGASYVVKGYTSAEDAKAAVKSFKASKIECWYNPALSGAEVEIIGVR